MDRRSQSFEATDFTQLLKGFAAGVLRIARRSTADGLPERRDLNGWHVDARVVEYFAAGGLETSR